MPQNINTRNRITPEGMAQGKSEATQLMNPGRIQNASDDALFVLATLINRELNKRNSSFARKGFHRWEQAI
jgi:hypothetical protein